MCDVFIDGSSSVCCPCATRNIGKGYKKWKNKQANKQIGVCIKTAFPFFPRHSLLAVWIQCSCIVIPMKDLRAPLFHRQLSHSNTHMHAFVLVSLRGLSLRWCITSLLPKTTTTESRNPILTLTSACGNQPTSHGFPWTFSSRIRIPPPQKKKHSLSAVATINTRSDWMQCLTFKKKTSEDVRVKYRKGRGAAVEDKRTPGASPAEDKFPQKSLEGRRCPENEKKAIFEWLLLKMTQALFACGCRWSLRACILTAPPVGEDGPVDEYQTWLLFVTDFIHLLDLVQTPVWSHLRSRHADQH